MGLQSAQIPPSTRCPTSRGTSNNNNNNWSTSDGWNFKFSKSSAHLYLYDVTLVPFAWTVCRVCSLADVRTITAGALTPSRRVNTRAPLWRHTKKQAHWHRWLCWTPRWPYLYLPPDLPPSSPPPHSLKICLMLYICTTRPMYYAVICYSEQHIYTHARIIARPIYMVFVYPTLSEELTRLYAANLECDASAGAYLYVCWYAFGGFHYAVILQTFVKATSGGSWAAIAGPLAHSSRQCFGSHRTRKTIVG